LAGQIAGPQCTPPTTEHCFPEGQAVTVTAPCASQWSSRPCVVQASCALGASDGSAAQSAETQRAVCAVAPAMEQNAPSALQSLRERMAPSWQWTTSFVPAQTSASPRAG